MSGYLKKEDWTLVGSIGVDAGICWIGDPCYILHREDYKDGKVVPAPLPESLGKDWPDFCNKLGFTYPTMKSFSYKHGGEGLGVVVSTGYGDGFYPVYVKLVPGTLLRDKDTKRIAAVFVDFFGDAFGDEETEESNNI